MVVFIETYCFPFVGYISYPRTESSRYPEHFDFNEVLRSLGSSNWGSIAKNLLQNGINKPRAGHDAGDHPPITPLKADRGTVFHLIPFPALIKTRDFGQTRVHTCHPPPLASFLERTIFMPPSLQLFPPTPPSLATVNLEFFFLLCSAERLH